MWSGVFQQASRTIAFAQMRRANLSATAEFLV